MLMKMSKVRNVKIPSRGHATDAGIDFYIPEFDKEFLDKLNDIHNYSILKDRDDSDRSCGISLNAYSNICIPSGIKVEIPYGYMGLFLNKSGVASKNELLIGAQVIDTFYSGEVHIDIHNVGKCGFVLTPGMKIAQLVLVPIIVFQPILVGEEELYDWMKQDSHRDEGGFGSTNKE